MVDRAPFASLSATLAPRVAVRSQSVKRGGRVYKDDYAWLRADNWKTVMRDPSALPDDIAAALKAENDYYAAATDELSALRETLKAEMRGRMKEDDESPPQPDGSFQYWERFREGGEYPVLMRARRGGDDPRILFDGDKEGAGEKFFDLGSVAHSPDHSLIAYAVDRVGSEYFTIRVRDAETGEERADRIENADEGGAVWSSDSGGFFYVERDDAQRPVRVRYHRLGASQSEDSVIYEESDPAFFVSVDESLSGEWVFIGAGSQGTNDIRVVPASDPSAPPRLIAPRKTGVEYDVDHRGDEFLILTNEGDAIDFKLMAAPISDPSAGAWREMQRHREGVYLLDVVAFKNFLVRVEREDARPRIVIVNADGVEHEIAFGEDAYSLGVDPGFEFDTSILRFSYESPTTPERIYDYDMATRERTLVKEERIPSGHDPENYRVERIEALAADGERVPVTVLRRKETALDGGAPLLLYGYGAYGITIPAGFSPNILSLVDRGMVYAIAHIRGGAAKGRRWYLDGKFGAKTNSFTDFIAAGEALAKKNYTSRGRIVAYGGSAGGLLVGAAVNQAPDLFAGVVGAVPFVDVLNTITDDTLPLTPPEWEEWGNPLTDENAYRWIASYSPYDNISEGRYPPILATAGLTDYRVTYWEPAKWIARLRATASGGPFLLRVNMDAGHGGSAARFEQLDERAHLYAFSLKCVGLAD